MGFSQLSVHVLGYREDREWVALALEMDLRGYGETFEAALTELRDLVLSQVAFAASKRQPELIWNPAEPVWFERFAEARQEAVSKLFEPESPGDSRFEIGALLLPSPQVLAELRPEFIRADA